jgi:hypothetical protein
MMIGTILYVAAWACVLVAAFNVPAKGVNLTALGLAFAVMPQVLIRFL